MALLVGWDAAPELIASPGVRRYARGLRDALAARPDVTLADLGPRRRERAHRRQRLAQGVAREGWHYVVGLERAARRAGADVVQLPSFPALRVGAPAVLALHDVLPLRHPELFPRVVVAHTRLTARRVRRVERVVVSTRHVRDEAIDALGLAPERIRVVPYGVEAWFAPRPADPERLRARFGIDRPYVLAVGTLEPRKNLLGALRALEAAALGDGVALVVAGGEGWKNEAFEREAARARVPLVRAGRVGDDELVDLYAGALCLVFPSLYEGYGLPVLEAMASGCPVVASDRSSLPEVVGDAGLVADPLDPEALGAAVRRVVADAGLRSELARRGLALAARRSWDAAAEDTLRVLQEAAASGPP